MRGFSRADFKSRLDAIRRNYRFRSLQSLKIRAPNHRVRRPGHIGFVIYFEIAQTCILRYYSTYCKQIERKSNYLLVKRLNIETKRK